MTRRQTLDYAFKLIHGESKYASRFRHHLKLLPNYTHRSSCPINSNHILYHNHTTTINNYSDSAFDRHWDDTDPRRDFAVAPCVVDLLPFLLAFVHFQSECAAVLWLESQNCDDTFFLAICEPMFALSGS